MTRGLRLSRFTALCLLAAVSIGACRIAVTEPDPPKEKSTPFDYYNTKTPPLYAARIAVKAPKTGRLSEDHSEKLLLSAAAGSGSELIELGHYARLPAEVAADGDELKIDLSFLASAGRSANKDSAKDSLPFVFGVNLPEERFSFDGRALRATNMAKGSYEVAVMLGINKESANYVIQGQPSGNQQCDHWEKGCAIGVVISAKAPAAKPEASAARKAAESVAGYPISIALLLPFALLAWRLRGHEEARRIIALASPSLAAKMPILAHSGKPFKPI